MATENQDELVFYTMTDFVRYDLPVEGIFGQCKPSNEYQELGRIDNGSSGTVYKVRDLKDKDTIVALKYIKFSENELPSEIFREVTILRQLDHKNVNRFVEVALNSDTNSIFLILEYCPYNLDEYVQRYPGEIPVTQSKCIIHQLLNGLSYLHHNFVVHRDVHPKNILISVDNILKIADFGSSRKYSVPLRLMSPGVGVIWYRAPEILFESKYYGPAVDIWSVGCVMAELLTKEVLIKGASDLNQINLMIDLLGSPNVGIWPGFKDCKIREKINIKNDKLFRKLESKFVNLGDSASSLLALLIQYDPIKRPSARDCLDDDWFQTAPIMSKQIETEFLKTELVPYASVT